MILGVRILIEQRDLVLVAVVEEAAVRILNLLLIRAVNFTPFAEFSNPLICCDTPLHMPVMSGRSKSAKWITLWFFKRNRAKLGERLGFQSQLWLRHLATLYSSSFAFEGINKYLLTSVKKTSFQLLEGLVCSWNLVQLIRRSWKNWRNWRKKRRRNVRLVFSGRRNSVLCYYWICEVYSCWYTFLGACLVWDSWMTVDYLSFFKLISQLFSLFFLIYLIILSNSIFSVLPEVVFGMLLLSF